jgi:DNA-binding response OmpR family regulator
LPTRALVVDDDLPTCQLIKTILNSADMEAMILTNSADAAELLQRQKFDVVFLDVNMPSPDGMELARHIRGGGLNQKTPLIMITGEEDPTVLTHGFQVGVNFFLFKPINRGRLLNLTRVTHSVIEREKRRFQRVAVRRKIQVRLDQENLEGETIDLSLNGALVQTSRTFPAGSSVQISLDLSPGRPPIACDGLVARLIGHTRMGIHFDRIGTAEGQRLEEFLLPLILVSTNPEAQPV